MKFIFCTFILFMFSTVLTEASFNFEELYDKQIEETIAEGSDLGFESETTDGSGVFSITSLGCDEFDNRSLAFNDSSQEERVEVIQLSYFDLKRRINGYDTEKKIQAIEALVTRVKHKSLEQKSAHYLGITHDLIDLLKKEKNVKIVSAACKALACLAYRQKEIQKSIEGSLSLFVNLSKVSNLEVRENVVWVLFNVISLDKYRRERFRAYNFLPDLPFFLVKEGSLAMKRRAAGLIFNLAKDKENRRIIGELNGVVSSLVRLACEKDRDCRKYAKLALKQLSLWNVKNRKAIRQAKHDQGLGVSCECCC